MFLIRFLYLKLLFREILTTCSGGVIARNVPQNEGQRLIFTRCHYLFGNALRCRVTSTSCVFVSFVFLCVTEKGQLTNLSTLANVIFKCYCFVCKFMVQHEINECGFVLL